MRGTARGGSRWTGSENDVAPSAMTLPSPATFDRLPGDLLGSLWARTSAILAGKHFKAAALLSPPLCFLLRETEVLSREVSSAVNAACTAMCAMYYVQGSKSRAPYTTSSRTPHAVIQNFYSRNARFVFAHSLSLTTNVGTQVSGQLAVHSASFLLDHALPPTHPSCPRRR